MECPNVRIPPKPAASEPLQMFPFSGSIHEMAKSVWRAVKFLIVDWTVTPRMLALNEGRPFVYQLVTTPAITLVFGLIIGAVIVVLSLMGIWPSR